MQSTPTREGNDLLDPEYVPTIEDELADVEAAIESADMERYFARHAEYAAKGRLGDPDTARARLVAEAFGDNPLTGEPYYTADDVLGWLRRAEEMGAARLNLGSKTLVKLYRRELVPNAILRERFLAQKPEDDEDEGMTAIAIARALGYTRMSEGREVGDAQYVERLLGLDPTPASRDDYSGSLRTFLPYDVAVRLAELVGVAYHDCGV